MSRINDLTSRLILKKLTTKEAINVIRYDMINAPISEKLFKAQMEGMDDDQIAILKHNILVINQVMAERGSDCPREITSNFYPDHRFGKRLRWERAVSFG